MLQPMQTADYLTALNILVAALGVFFVGFTVLEWRKLSKLRKDFAKFKEEVRAETFAAQKAMQRVMVSYGISDPEKKIQLLEETARLYPKAFNVYNALGWAYLEASHVQKAIDAFQEAVNRHPEEKSGYFDLAYGHKAMGNDELCLKYLRRAIKVDPTSLDDLKDNHLYKNIADKV